MKTLIISLSTVNTIIKRPQESREIPFHKDEIKIGWL